MFDSRDLVPVVGGREGEGEEGITTPLECEFFELSFFSLFPPFSKLRDPGRPLQCLAVKGATLWSSNNGHPYWWYVVPLFSPSRVAQVVRGN